MMVSVPVCVPLFVGVNVTFTVQEVPTASELPHAVAANGPVARTLLMVTGELPVFVTVTGLGWLVVPTFCFPKVRLVGETLTVPADEDPPVPVSGIV